MNKLVFCSCFCFQGTNNHSSFRHFTSEPRRYLSWSMGTYCCSRTRQHPQCFLHRTPNIECRLRFIRMIKMDRIGFCDLQVGLHYQKLGHWSTRPASSEALTENCWRSGQENERGTQCGNLARYHCNTPPFIGTELFYSN